MGLGSTTEGESKEVEEKVNVKKLQAVLDGVQFQFSELRQLLENYHQQLQAMQGLYFTLEKQLQGFEDARIRELTLRVNGGPTERGDFDRPSNEGN